MACRGAGAVQPGPRTSVPTPGQWFAGLDGFRGLAVIAVVLFHADLLVGGWLGVDLFFVLSGLLISRLITIEHRTSGAISLRAFWHRRARRLLPALVVFFPAVALVVVWTPDRQSLPTNLGAEMVAAIAYVANWFTLASTSGYWDEFSAASPLRHMWSLAIEEQFYLVFPLVAAAAFATRRRHALGWILGGATLASWGWAMYLLATGSSFERAYLGTDTRLAAITLGGVAGIASTSDRVMRSVMPIIRWSAWPAFAIVIAGFITVSGDPSWTARQWTILPVFEIAVVVLLIAVLGGGPTGIGRLMSIRVLVWFGTISYGLYLWHIPVQFVLLQRWPGLDASRIAGLTLGIGSVLAWWSYVVIERPLRHRGLAGVFGAPGRQLAAVGAAVLLLIGGVVVTARATPEDRSVALVSELLPQVHDTTGEPSSTRPPRTAELEPTMPPTPAIVGEVASGELGEPDRPPASLTATDTAPDTATGYATDTAPDTGPDGGDENGVTTGALPMPRPSDRPPSVLVLGDSMVALLEDRLVADAERLGVTFAATSHIGCPVGGREVGGSDTLDNERFVRSCDEWLASLPSVAALVDPDVMVIIRTSTRTPSPTTGPHVCDDRYQDWLRAVTIAEIESLAEVTDASIVLTTQAYRRYGGVRDDDRDRATECINTSLDEVAAATDAQIVDLASWVCPTADTCRNEHGGILLRRDGLHFEDEGASLMLEWLVDQIFLDP